MPPLRPLPVPAAYRTRRPAPGSVLLLALSPALALAQGGDTARVVAAKPATWHLQATAFHSQANNGIGTWRGQDVRLLYSGKRFSPFVSVGRQTRPAGHQEVAAVGSYVVLTPWAFTIVGMGVAPDYGTVLFPKRRTDASLYLSVPKVRGLLVSGGVTDLRFTDPRTGGTILSVGPTLYFGRGIYTASLFLNRDRASGARSSSWQTGAQWGTQGKYWVGAGMGAGNEAYRILSATPFDARFRSRFYSAFVSKWITTGTGVSLRLDYEDKIDAFQRRALGLSYFVDF